MSRRDLHARRRPVELDLEREHGGYRFVVRTPPEAWSPPPWEPIDAFLSVVVRMCRLS